MLLDDVIESAQSLEEIDGLCSSTELPRMVHGREP